MKHVVLAVVLAFSLCIAFAGCGGGNGNNEQIKQDVKEPTKPDVKEGAKEPEKPDVKEVMHEAMNEKAEIPAESETIVYAGGGGWGPSLFKHAQHAHEYYDGDCYVCHDHYEENMACRDCHTTGRDVEDLCDEDADHGCIMRQCQECHVNHGSPAPDGSSCGHCHELPPYANAFELPGLLGAST